MDILLHFWDEKGKSPFLPKISTRTKNTNFQSKQKSNNNEILKTIDADIFTLTCIGNRSVFALFHC